MNRGNIMARNKRDPYDSEYIGSGYRSSSESRRQRSHTNETSYRSPSFDTEAVTRNLELQAEEQIRTTRRQKTYATGPLPTDEFSSHRRRTGSTARRTGSADPYEPDLAEKRFQMRKQHRREALRWRRAHWIVRFMILVVLILDILVLRFGVFSGGFLPVWNILTAHKGVSQTAEQPASDIDLTISEQLLTVNAYSRPGTALDAVNGIVIHYIGNAGTDAQENREYFENLKDGAADVYASCNYIIGLDGTIIQCVPDNEVAYASGERNNDTISIECCHPDDSGAFTTETFNSLVKLTAKLCQEYGLSTDQILRHYDVNEKPCPKFFVDDPDAWTNFLASVQAYL